ncbi:MAG: hypothetical protein RLZZ236_1988 [Bacteroidota bacterium]|jgi:transcription elongation factor Elf1
MEKEFIDYLYELRGLIQNDINRLVELNKEPRNANCKDCGDEIQAELRTRRSQISSVNQTIEKYFKTHSRNL